MKFLIADEILDKFCFEKLSMVILYWSKGNRSLREESWIKTEVVSVHVRKYYFLWTYNFNIWDYYI